MASSMASAAACSSNTSRAVEPHPTALPKRTATCGKCRSHRRCCSLIDKQRGQGSRLPAVRSTQPVQDFSLSECRLATAGVPACDAHRSVAAMTCQQWCSIGRLTGGCMLQRPTTSTAGSTHLISAGDGHKVGHSLFRIHGCQPLCGDLWSAADPGWAQARCSRKDRTAAVGTETCRPAAAWAAMNMASAVRAV